MKYILSAIVLFLAVESGAADVETPTMGWSSWNAFRVNISEGTIKVFGDSMLPDIDCLVLSAVQ